MSSRRGLLAAFLLSFSPLKAEAKKKHKKKHRPDPVPYYTAVINDYQVTWRDEARQVVSDYADKLRPYAVSVSYVEKEPTLCKADVSLCQSPENISGAAASGWGRWVREDRHWNLYGGVTVSLDEYSLPRLGGEKRFVLCHEIGHAFGLDHVPIGTNSCMQTPAAGEIGPWKNVEYPTDQDIANIVARLPKG